MSDDNILIECVSCTNKLPMQRQLIYDESKCYECTMRYEKNKQLTDSILGDTPMYCSRGCGIRGKSNEISAHEPFCRKKMQKYLCMIGNCARTETAKDLMKHVQSEHANHLIVLHHFPGHEIPISNTDEVKLILSHELSYIKNELYWMRIFTYGKECHMIIEHFASIDRESRDTNMTYTSFHLKSNTIKGITITGDIVPINESSISLENRMSWDITPLMKDDLILSMNNSAVQKLSQDFLSEFDCEICSEVLVAPIRLCLTGHSMCNDCSKKCHECPKCKARLSHARNYSLERMSNQVNASCKYRSVGCLENPRVSELQNHMTRCGFRSCHCVTCDWKGTFVDLTEHCKYNCSTSYKNLGVANTIPELFPIKNSNTPTHMQTFVFLSFDEVFHLHITEEDKNYHFSVDNYTKTRNIEYYFELTVSDVKENKAIAFSTKCDIETKCSIPVGYFKKNNALQYVLLVYEKAPVPVLQCNNALLY